MLELNEQLSDIFEKLANEQYIFATLEESLQSVIYDTETKLIYSYSDDVQYYKEYIWRYNHSRITWDKFYPKPQ